MSDMEEDALSDVEGGEETNQEGAVEEEEEEKVESCHLTLETISQRLSLLCRTGNGLGHAFVNMDLKDCGLKDITEISSFIYIRSLDLSNNQITDLSPLASLTQLLWLKVDNNAVAGFNQPTFEKFTYLQWLSMAGNKLTGVQGLVGPALESLNLAGNGIQRLNELQGSCFANLVTLELRGNNLDTTDGINLPNLQHLYLAQTSMKCLEGLEGLKSLTTLHLRDNQLDTLEGLSSNMKCLQYLNVRGNLLSGKNSIQSLGRVSKSLKTLVLSENPLTETTDYRLGVLILLPKLERLDKDLVSPEEMTEALERRMELTKEEIPGP